MEDKLKKYIREYVMFLYKQKMDFEPTYHYTTDIEHPIQQGEYPSDNILPPAFTRGTHSIGVNRRF
tara:strand:- start:362 stop:559 length:198 start_codon:yes stop_codon:yes gene_type:complete